MILQGRYLRKSSFGTRFAPKKRKRFWKPRAKPVTLLAGIICKDGIVVAGDSQTTWGSGKSWSANKMTELSLPFGRRALVAESGTVISSSRVTEHLAELAEDTELFKQHGLSGLAELAVKKVRDHLRHQQFDCTSEEFQDFIDRQEMDCALMLAYYDNIPRIETISLSLGMIQRAKSFFEVLGSGSDLADYILTDLCIPDLEWSVASVIAVHTVEMVKRHDPYVGGPTKVGILRIPTMRAPHPMLGMFYTSPTILGESEVSEIIQMVQEVDQDTKKKRGNAIRDALERKTELRLKEIQSHLDDFC